MFLLFKDVVICFVFLITFYVEFCTSV